jgi:two-component system response regulator AtoC
MRVLIIDDEPELAAVLGRLIQAWGHEAATETSGQSGLRRQASWAADLVFLDVGLPDQSGLEVLKELKRLGPDTPVVMLTANDSSRLAVQALRSGAEDYVVKPAEPEELKLLIERLAEASTLRRELLALRSQAARGYLFLQHPKMRDVYASLGRVAATDKVTVLIQGETGTGKEHAARLLHQLSPRNPRPFVELHCAALPETLLESELFGYEAGAFTDARRAKPGLFEQAQGGTLFLDEIGELPLNMQTKLLKVLEARQLRRLGGVREVNLDVRLVVATNRDLLVEAKAGRFRPDLLYRLQVFTVELPPLRERPEDIESLSLFFYDQFCKDFGRRLEPLAGPVLRALMAYAWPGNIRELRNTIERLVIQTSAGAPRVEDLPPSLRTPEQNAPAHAWAGRPRQENAEALKALLEKHRWNRTKAALELGVSRPTFLKRLKEAGVE